MPSLRCGSQPLKRIVPFTSSAFIKCKTHVFRGSRIKLDFNKLAHECITRWKLLIDSVNCIRVCWKWCACLYIYAHEHTPEERTRDFVN